MKNDILTIIGEYLERHYIMSSFLLAVIVCFLRTNRKCLINRISDSMLCGAVSTGLSYGIISLCEVNVYICFFIATSVGYLGTEEIKRIIFRRFLNERIDD